MRTHSGPRRRKTSGGVAGGRTGRRRRRGGSVRNEGKPASRRTAAGRLQARSPHGTFDLGLVPFRHPVTGGNHMKSLGFVFLAGAVVCLGSCTTVPKILGG